MNNVVSLQAFKNTKQVLVEDREYRTRILSMDKLQLLEEMVRFQEERGRLGHMTLQMMIRGQLLFKTLEEKAGTPDLRILTRSYRRYLDFEIASYMDANK